MQAFLDSARGADIHPKRTASGSLIVRRGTSYRALVDASGRKTAAGKYWERLTGSTIPSEAEAPRGAPVRRKNKEFLQVRGKERLLRTYDPVTNDWKYSRLGKQHYKTARMQYVVKVPSVHSGQRSNRTAYTRQGFFPIDTPVSVAATLSQAQRDAEIRRRVNELFPDGLLAEFSGETIKIDAGRPWQISEMTTSPSDARPRVEITDRPLGVNPKGLSTLLFPEHVCPLAFEDHNDRLCVARQIAHIMGYAFDDVLAEFDQIELDMYNTTEWRANGIRSRMIFLYAQRRTIEARVVSTPRR
jgi:hypothetical protein